MAYANAGKKVDEAGNPIPDIPPDPTREALRPLLTELYGNKERLPDVLEADISTSDGLNYSITPGVMSVVRVRKGLSKDDKAKAIVQGIAEADSWTLPQERPPRLRRPHREDQVQLRRRDQGQDPALVRRPAPDRVLQLARGRQGDRPAAGRGQGRRGGDEDRLRRGPRQVLAEVDGREDVRASHGRRRRALPQHAAHDLPGPRPGGAAAA
jgi:hypothetical protein